MISFFIDGMKAKSGVVLLLIQSRSRETPGSKLSSIVSSQLHRNVTLAQIIPSIINWKIEKGKLFQKEHVKAEPGLRKNGKSSLLNFAARELPNNTIITVQ